MKKVFLLALVLIVSGFLLFRGRPPASIKIPVDFSCHLLYPLIKIQVEGKNYDILVDTGSCSNEITLNKNVINKIQKKNLVEEFGLCDLRGNSYACLMYRIPEIKIKHTSFYNLSVTEQNDDYKSSVLVWPSSNVEQRKQDRIKGKIGLPVFQNYCCLIDFPNSQIILQKDIEELVDILASDDFNCVPFSIESCGVVISVQTDVGVQRMILDTGATYSVISSSISKNAVVEEIQMGSDKWCYSTEKLLIGKCDYGSWDFALFEVGEEFEVDGCLGADFFLENSVVLDFKNKNAYIKKPEKSLVLAQYKRMKLRVSQFCDKMISYVNRFNE